MAYNPYKAVKSIAEQKDGWYKANKSGHTIFLLITETSMSVSFLLITLLSFFFYVST